jgi:hypothetical protein
VAARDAAGNVAEGPLALTLRAPDVAPPQVLAATASNGASDTTIRLTAVLDEACSLAYVVLAANAIAPSASQVRAAAQRWQRAPLSPQP